MKCSGRGKLQGVQRQRQRETETGSGTSLIFKLTVYCAFHYNFCLLVLLSQTKLNADALWAKLQQLLWAWQWAQGVAYYNRVFGCKGEQKKIARRTRAWSQNVELQLALRCHCPATDPPHPTPQPAPLSLYLSLSTRPVPSLGAQRHFSQTEVIKDAADSSHLAGEAEHKRERERRRERSS